MSGKSTNFIWGESTHYEVNINKMKVKKIVKQCNSYYLLFMYIYS